MVSPDRAQSSSSSSSITIVGSTGTSSRFCMTSLVSSTTLDSTCAAFTEGATEWGFIVFLRLAPDATVVNDKTSRICRTCNFMIGRC
jgi:hypothetical protein